MRRTLPRLSALLLAISCVVAASAPASAQEQVAVAMNTNAFVLPASMTSTVLFPATSTANAAESATPVPVIARVERYDGPRRPTVLPALYASSAVLQALDAHSTMKAISAGAHEANPFMKGAASNSGALIAVKAGVVGASIYLCEKMWKRNPAGAIAVMAAINGVSAVVVAHNYKVARGLR
jgi:hypothetical protein